MLKKNKLPVINDNATDAELRKMVHDLMTSNKPIDLSKELCSDNNNDEMQYPKERAVG